MAASAHTLTAPSDVNSGRGSQKGPIVVTTASSRVNPASPSSHPHSSDVVVAAIHSPSSSTSVASSPSPSVGVTSPTSASPLAPYLHFLDMKRAPVGLVTNLSQRNPMQVVNTACPLLGGAQLLTGLIGANSAGGDEKRGKAKASSAVDRLWKKKAGGASAASEGAGAGAGGRSELYRLTVLDKDGAFVGCLTQLQLAAWVKARLEMLGALADESLVSLGLGRSQRVMTISWRSPVLTALLLMHDRRISALAIVNDSNGRLVGTISCSDVKFLFLAPDLLLTLQKPVSVFIAALRQSQSLWHVNVSAANAPATATSASVTVGPKSSLRAAVDVLLARNVRRAWVVNESEQPIGMVSVADVVKLALPRPAPHPAPHSTHAH